MLAVGLIAAVVLTSGFGLIGGGDETKEKGARKAQEEKKPEVAVLNATQTPSGVQGVLGLAKKVASEVVKPAGYPIGVTTDAPSGFSETVVMFEPKAEGDAAELARAVESKLGETSTEPIASDVAAIAEGAPLVLVVGADDAEF